MNASHIYFLEYNAPNINDINYNYAYATIIVTAKIDYEFARKYKQTPFFSITGQVLNGYGTCLACGCVHDYMLEAIAEKKQEGNLAELIPELIKWHLFNINGEPSYYIENAMFWFEERNWHNFESIIVMGASPLDADMIDVYRTMEPEEVIAWLEARKSHLHAAFFKAMDKANLLVKTILENE